MFNFIDTWINYVFDKLSMNTIKNGKNVINVQINNLPSIKC